jgi:hypothetical protein
LARPPLPDKKLKPVVHYFARIIKYALQRNEQKVQVLAIMPQQYGGNPTNWRRSMARLVQQAA